MSTQVQKNQPNVGSWFSPLSTLGGASTTVIASAKGMAEKKPNTDEKEPLKVPSVPVRSLCETLTHYRIRIPKRAFYKQLRVPKQVQKSGRMGQLKLFHAELAMSYAWNLTINSVAGKYLQVLGGSTKFLWSSILSGLTELTTLNSLFQEFCVLGMELKFVPINGASANCTANAAITTAAGAPGFLNTCAATIAMLPHGQGPYSDTSSVFYGLMDEEQHFVFDTGKNQEFLFYNPDRAALGWDAPMLDQSSSATTMGWCNIQQTSLYGGSFQLATPFVSGAAAGIGDLVESAVVGTYAAKVFIRLRARS